MSNEKAAGKGAYLNENAKVYSKLYRDALLADVMPFWSKHSVDWEHGGYFTCLERDGSVFDTDKFVWLQARQVWMYSKLYNAKEQKGEWLDIADNGARFLADHGTDPHGNWYFSLNKEGNPLVQPYNIFSDCFASMAFAQYAKASQRDWAFQLALTTFDNIQRRKNNPKGQYNKAVPGARPFNGLALPMIETNLCLEIAEVESVPELDTSVNENLELIMERFIHKEKMITLENISDSPGADDSFEGRLLIPGHGIECMWFIMEAAKKNNNTAMIEKACDVVLNTLEFAWDKEFGGIYYFLDIKGKPPDQLSWDQKLWWVHLETLYALALGYSLTGRGELSEWYRKVHGYSWQHFSDPEYGEWFGYLTRRGERLLDIKGGKWKGCFHVPRALMLCADIFDEIEKKTI